MKVTSTYPIRIRGRQYSRVFKDTAAVYNAAVTWFIDLVNREWDIFLPLTSAKSAVTEGERLCVKTKKRCVTKYDFSEAFYKFPSYLRRAAIREAYGKVRSYRSNLADWQSLPEDRRGREPGLPKAGHDFPALYRKNMFVREDAMTAKIKVFIHNTWDFITVSLRKTDVDYVLHHCFGRKECCPTLQKRHKVWELDFPFEKICTLNETKVSDQRIISVDLGINNCCACAAILPDGTVVGRKFLKLPAEYDCLRQHTDRIKYAQSHGSRSVRRLWKLADGVNDDIAAKTAAFIMDFAVSHHADVIVFEHLGLNGKKHGPKKQKLHLWKTRRVQGIVEQRAHLLSMHVSHVCAWGTSRLAFDGSGRVKRGRESEKTDGSYSVCEFTSGKVYNCDLNAAYNIGARYFIREILKSLPARKRQGTLAKVPECSKRSTCTLSSLISLNSVLCASA